MSPTQIVWVAHGCPVVDDCSPADGLCYVCASPMQRGKSLKKWLNSNYTDQNRVSAPTATHVCEACCYVHSRTSPVLGRPAKEGKKFGGNFRNYSHLYESGWDSPPFAPVKDDDGAVIRHDGPPGLGYINASKGDKGYIRDFLSREHAGTWFASIADSGQKHVLPFAPMNGAGGRAGLVIFEEAIVEVPDDQFLLADMTSLLSAGVTKDELERGDYYVRTMIENRSAVCEFEETHGAQRGGGWFRLSIWLAQRDEEKFKAVETTRKEKRDAKRKTKKRDGNADRGADSQSTERVSEQRRRASGTGLLDATAKPLPSSGETVRDSKRVDERGAEEDVDSGAAQLGLPGLD